MTPNVSIVVEWDNVVARRNSAESAGSRWGDCATNDSLSSGCGSTW